jgi:bifunctional UDP-N-acetylglucosamine pyrophosphorylase / glucosamine-1-phosphate N-acetyltransferase
MLDNNFTAIVLAAGQGTRMKSKRPKVLHQILGRPMIAYLLDTLREIGVNDMVVVVGYQAEAVQTALAHDTVRFVLQEPQLGTGHAVQVAMTALPSGVKTVMVLCGDVPLIPPESLIGLQRLHDRTRAVVTVQTAVLLDGGHYGRVVRDAQDRVMEVVQARDATPEVLKIREINTGTYVFDVPFLEAHLGGLRANNVQKEIYLTDLILMATQQGRVVEALAEREWENVLGINSRAELAAAGQIVKRKINAGHMDQGVTLIDPESTYIESLVVIGRDSIIYPNVYLQGRTAIGENCVIEPSVKIVDSVLENDVLVKMGCVVTESRLGSRVSLGPWAHLRPGSDLRSGSKVGNFVEVKKSVLHEGVKAGHLTYLGDADVGSGANVGAGTITCNYDGVKKHRTIIGEGAFIGSNTALVAPVTIGAGAYVGAGSTITEDVPAGKLAIGRARQVTKDRRIFGKKQG